VSAEPGPLAVERIGIVGAGTMGTGIALIACLGDFPTLIYDPDENALVEAQVKVGEMLAEGGGKHWDAEDAEVASERLWPAARVSDLSACDLVIEAAPEDLALKRRIFSELAAACGPETILATNTSSLRVTDIGADVPHPERVVGMHFFNPPARMKLVEVVATDLSSAAALDATAAAAEQMGRMPIRAKDSPGFLANRLARPFSLESLRMLADEVADAETIDRVCRIGGGFRMGPFELLDLIGLDVNLSVARSFYEQGGRPERWRPSPIQERMVATGRLGRKSGLGFYSYDEEPYREQDPELGVRAPTLDAEELRGVDPAAAEILLRLVAQIANEGAFTLEEGIGTPADINAAMRHGFNWPLGPLEFTGLIGARRAVNLLEELQERLGGAYMPAPRLLAAAEEEGR
jgi:3-hydroxybutyryl-CoA dehydrogenase